MVYQMPKRGLDGFVCPHCEHHAHQTWGALHAVAGHWGNAKLVDWAASRCARCDEFALWLEEDLVYPRMRLGATPADEMPAQILALYDEARDVSSVSRRSAAALLRLALQLLVDELDDGRGNIDAKIGRLVKKRGLHPTVSKAMDYVRVAGNNAVHPGQIDVDEDPEVVPAMFDLLNLIVEQVLVRDERVTALFNTLPEGAREAVARRDEDAPSGDSS